MARIAKNQTSSPITIDDLAGVVIPASGQYDLSIQFNQSELANSSDLITEISSGNIVLNDGASDLLVSDAIDLLKGYQQKTITMTDGRLMFNTTARPYGSYIYFTSEGDDASAFNKVGNGGASNILKLSHFVGNPTTQNVYFDLNMAENRTWINQGYCCWSGAEFDTITLEIVPKVTSVTPTASPTPYRLYGGYLIVPSVLGAGYGDYVDIADVDRNLIYVPINQFGVRGTCFWNATYSTSSHSYTNITAAPYANGQYNMMAAEVVLSRFVNKIYLHGTSNGLFALDSNEATEIGQGMRFRLKGITQNSDHDWNISVVLVMFRQKTV